MTSIPTLESFLARWEACGASERANYQLLLAELRAQLSQTGSGTTAEALAKRFQGARAGQVGLLLEAMAALGQVHESEGRFAA